MKQNLKAISTLKEQALMQFDKETGFLRIPFLDPAARFTKEVIPFDRSTETDVSV